MRFIISEITQHRRHWFKCELEENPAIFGVGPTHNEAVGFLFTAHRDYFRMEFQFPSLCKGIGVLSLPPEAEGEK